MHFKIQEIWRIIFILVGFISFSQAQAQAQAPIQANTAVAPVDTAVVEIVFPEGTANCVSMQTSADTLGFGIAATIGFSFSEDVINLTAEKLELTETWLKLSDLPSQGGAKEFLFELRVYRLHPFRIKVNSIMGPVISVSGAASDLNETAAIRMPGVWGTRWWILILPALILAALGIGLYLLWQRRIRLEELQQWDPAPPAWLKTAVDLRTLLSADFPSPDSVRVFLDRLANITRCYLGGRYLVQANELTSREILIKCLAKGHDSRELRRLIKILDELDNQRYNPELPDVSWSRLQAVEFLKVVQEVRILPQYTPVEPELLIEADKAWAWLTEAGNHPSNQTVAGGEND